MRDCSPITTDPLTALKTGKRLTSSCGPPMPSQGTQMLYDAPSSAGLALGNLRLDLITFQSSGLQTALSDVSTATPDARALSRDIDALLDAAAEMKSL